MHVIFLILVTTLCTIGSQIILKGAVGPIVQVFREEGILQFLFAAATSPKVIAALALQAMGFLTWFFVLAQSKLSTAFATSGAFFYILMAAASWYAYGERLTPLQWLALMLISGGVFLLNAKIS